jgi:hypothetical protein
MAIAGAFALLCVVVGYGATVVLRGGEDPYPDAWDPRIEPLVRFVEEARGAPFLHPVHVDFVEAGTFDDSVVSSAEPTDEERAEAERYTGLYRAFGLVSGELDLFESGDQIATEGVAAFYSSDTKRITIDGTELDPALRATVVHELVHAWQDQTLDLGEIEERIDLAAFDAYRAAVEGDATRIEYRYYWEVLSDAERAEADEANSVAYADVDMGDVPRVLVSEFGAPYALGEPYVGILSVVRGDTAIDEAIQHPTASSKVLLDPFAALDDHEPKLVGEPSLVDGEERFDGGTLGALFLYLTLNERLGSTAAIAAVDGWSGDAYVAFTRDERACVRAEIHGESAEDLQRLGGALTAWAGAMPPGTAQVTVTDTVDIESCDPGAGTALAAPAQPDLDPLVVPATRMSITHGMFLEGAGVEFARCATETIMGQLTTEHFMAVGDEFSAEFEAIGVGAGEACAHHN